MLLIILTVVTLSFDYMEAQNLVRKILKVCIFLKFWLISIPLAALVQSHNL